jgi:hypothetical protein
MRPIVFVLPFALAAVPALANDPAPDPTPPAKIELSQGICKNGIFGFHLKTEGATEGNVYITLDSIARLCQRGREDDAPQPQEERRPHEPLPQADRV